MNCNLWYRFPCLAVSVLHYSLFNYPVFRHRNCHLDGTGAAEMRLHRIDRRTHIQVLLVSNHFEAVLVNIFERSPLLVEAIIKTRVPNDVAIYLVTILAIFVGQYAINILDTFCAYFI